MTEERQAEILDFGWEVMKYMKAPNVALWLAEDGWRGGTTIEASLHDGTQAQLVLKNWEDLVLHHTVNPN